MQCPPSPRSGIEGGEAERFGLGGFYHFPEVDIHTVAENCQLVNQADVDVAVGVFQDFCHLCHGGRGDGMYLIAQDGSVYGGNHFLGVFAYGSYYFRGVLGFVNCVARVYPFGGKAQIEVFAALQPGTFFKNRFYEFFGSAGIGRGFQYHYRAFGEIAGYRLRRILHIADVRLLVYIQRGGYANGYEVHFFYEREIGSGAEHAVVYQLCQLCIDHVADVVVSGIHLFYLFFLYIETDSSEPGFCFFYSKGQADIA